MSGTTTFRSSDSPEINCSVHSDFDLTDQFFAFDDWKVEDAHDTVVPIVPGFSGSIPSLQTPPDSTGIGSAANHILDRLSHGEGGRERRKKVAFKTKSEVENLDDGFRWRKYGKKMVKNSPNPRNYYKCAIEGCPVKKQVERDREDPRYVITRYEGIHNHQGR